MFTTTDADGKRVKLASTENDNGEHTLSVSGGGEGGGSGGQVEVTNFPETQPVSGPLTNAQLLAAALATEAKQDSILTVLGNILTELQTANTHLEAIASNTAGGGV